MDDRAAGIYFFAACATARPLPQPALGRIPIAMLHRQPHQAFKRPCGFGVLRQRPMCQRLGFRRVLHARQIKQPLKAQL